MALAVNNETLVPNVTVNDGNIPPFLYDAPTPNPQALYDNNPFPVFADNLTFSPLAKETSTPAPSPDFLTLDQYNFYQGEYLKYIEAQRTAPTPTTFLQFLDPEKAAIYMQLYNASIAFDISKGSVDNANKNVYAPPPPNYVPPAVNPATPTGGSEQFMPKSVAKEGANYALTLANGKKIVITGADGELIAKTMEDVLKSSPDIRSAIGEAFAVSVPKDGEKGTSDYITIKSTNLETGVRGSTPLRADGSSSADGIFELDMAEIRKSSNNPNTATARVLIHELGHVVNGVCPECAKGVDNAKAVGIAGDTRMNHHGRDHSAFIAGGLEDYLGYTNQTMNFDQEDYSLDARIFDSNANVAAYKTIKTQYGQTYQDIAKAVYDTKDYAAAAKLIEAIPATKTIDITSANAQQGLAAVKETVNLRELMMQELIWETMDSRVFGQTGEAGGREDTAAAASLAAFYAASPTIKASFDKALDYTGYEIGG